MVIPLDARDALDLVEAARAALPSFKEHVRWLGVVGIEVPDDADASAVWRERRLLDYGLGRDVVTLVAQVLREEAVGAQRLAETAEPLALGHVVVVLVQASRVECRWAAVAADE